MQDSSETGATAASSRAAPAASTKEQKARVLRWLQAPAAQPFLKAQIEVIQTEFNLDIKSAEDVVNFFADCRPEEVQRRFHSVRRSANRLVGAGDRDGMRQAVSGLYLLAATRLVNVAASRIGGSALAHRLAREDLNLCAVVASSLIGGELQFKLAADGESWVPSHMFHVHVPVCGGNERNAFLRQAYNRLVLGSRDEEHDPEIVRKSREDAELSPSEAARLASELDDLRYVQDVTLGLLHTGSLMDEQTVLAIADTYQVPLFQHASGATESFVAMSEERLLAELQQLWKLFPGPAAKLPDGDDGDMAHRLDQLAELAKAQGARDLIKAVEDMRAALNKGAGADTDHLKRAAETAKNLATVAKETETTVESATKIAGVAHQLYNLAAPMIGLPPLP